MRYTFKDFKAEYPDDAACLRAVLENRYGDTCPRCGVVGVKWHPIKGRMGFVCSECDRHIYPLANTIFRSTHVSLWDWFHAIYLFSVAKNGVSANELTRVTGYPYKTCWRMCKQIRLLMAQETGDILGGDGTPVQVDETFVGGKEKYTNGSHYGMKKIPVFGAVEKDGTAKTMVTDYATSGRAKSFVRANIEAGALLHTDESSIYRWTKGEYERQSVKHRSNEYVRGLVHTNTIEGFWSQLKRSIDGTYHVVSPKYLQHYVNQFTFYYNHRATACFPALLAQAWKRV